jgi:uncharacterized repeat protein (TIGR01451 family)
MKKLFLLIFSIYFLANITAQGWLRTLNHNGGIEALIPINNGTSYYAKSISYSTWPHADRSIHLNSSGDSIFANCLYDSTSSYFINLNETNDGNLLNIYNSYIGQDQGILIKKTDLFGNALWAKNYNFFPDSIADEYLFHFCNTFDGGYFLVGSIARNNSQNWPIDGYPLFYCLLNSNGDTVFVDTFQNSGLANSFQKVTQLPDSSFLIVSSANTPYSLHNAAFPNTNLLKIDNLGNITNSIIIQGFSPTNCVFTLDSSIVIAGVDINNNNILKKFDYAGNEIWNRQLTGNNLSYLTHILITNDGGYFFVGNGRTQGPFSSGSFHFILKTDGQGNPLWSKHLLFPYCDQSIHTLCNTQDDDYLLGGYRSQYCSSDVVPILIKLDSSGRIFTNLIEGTIMQDNNYNCLADSGDISLNNMIIRLSKGPDTLYYPVNNGYYNFDVDTGSYALSCLQPNQPNYWQSCTSDTSVQVQLNDSVRVNFPQQATVSCPLLVTDIANDFFRRCFLNTYYVSVRNEGSENAYNAFADVLIDSNTTFISSSIPYAYNSGNLYQFQFDTLSVGETVFFTIMVYDSCQLELGSRYCANIHVYPDTICNNWTGPQLSVAGVCLGDSVQFIVTNNGSTMNSPLSYWAYIDTVFVLSDSVLLVQGASDTVVIYTAGQDIYANYNFWIEQPTGLPSWLGAPWSASFVADCFVGSNISQRFNSDDFIVMPYFSSECVHSIGAFDPNDKQGFPEGIGEEHAIAPNTPLEYMIRFQNTGTDTAFTVVIRDTISSLLDIGTLQLGLSSHSYTWRILEQNILEITYSNIMLPDSNINEPASHGFVKYNIRQKVNNPNLSQITNSAAIYFDFNEPVITNNTLHTVRYDIFNELYSSVFQSSGETDNDFSIYPNPVTSDLNIEQKNNENYRAELYDINGRLLKSILFSDFQEKISLNEYPNGTYILKITNKRNIKSFKVIIAR